MRKHRIETPLRIEEVPGLGRRAFFEVDGTRYEALAIPISNFGLQSLGRIDLDGFLVICGLNRLSYLFQKSGFLATSYVAEKFKLGQCDAENLTFALGELLGRPTPEYNTT